jgi:uncharacterized protein involved in exopolysaccharide biosynthesis
MEMNQSPQTLPVRLNGGNPRTLTLPLEAYHVAPAADPETVQASLPLSHYLWVLNRYRWRILGFIVVCLIATFIVSVRMTKVYESTATVDIDRRIPTEILGAGASQLSTNDSDQFISTQMKLVQSDGVLRPVARKYICGSWRTRPSAA